MKSTTRIPFNVDARGFFAGRTNLGSAFIVVWPSGFAQRRSSVSRDVGPDRSIASPHPSGCLLVGLARTHSLERCSQCRMRTTIPRAMLIARETAFAIFLRCRSLPLLLSADLNLEGNRRNKERECRSPSFTKKQQRLGREHRVHRLTGQDPGNPA